MSPSDVSWRFRFLHRFYCRSATFQFWLSQRIRSAGIFALIVTALASFFCVGHPKDSIFQLFCFSFGLVAFTIIWSTLRRANVTAEIKVPKYATVGEELRYSVELRNKNSSTLRNLRLIQVPPDPRPSLLEFSQTEEPFENIRNAYDRTIAYYRWRWLISRNTTFTSNESKNSFDLTNHKKHTIPLTITVAKRGVYLLENLQLLMPDPLGFFQKSSPLSPSPSRLIALPKRYALPHFEMPGSSTFRIGGEETSNAIGTFGEFLSIREYRPGDSLRQIHWKSWAHTGRPMVKELEDTFYPRYALILDTSPGSCDRMVFEEMVSISSSFITSLDHSDALLDLMFIADHAHIVTAGRGYERTEKLLEVLANVQIDPIPRFDVLSSTVIQHCDRITSCLLVLNGWDEQRIEFIKKLRKAGILCVPIIVGRDEAPSNIPGYWVDSNHVARDLMRLPSQLSGF
jgi:uncharacterized protein (DUF58 family)